MDCARPPVTANSLRARALPVHFETKVAQNMRRFLPLILLAAVVAFDVPVYAQNDATKGDGEPEVRETRDGGRRGRRGRRERRGPNLDEFYQRLTGEIELDEDQQAQLEEIKAAQQQRMDDFRAKREEIRAAREAGDEETANRLRDEMRSNFERGVGRRGPMGETIEQIEGILNDDQLQQFQTMQQTMREEREQQMRQRFDERYERIATDLDLDEDQRVVLDDIKAAQMEDMDEVRQAYDEGDEAYADELRQELITEMRESGGPRAFMNRVWDELDPVLTDDQRTLAEEMRDERRQRRRNRWQERQNDEAPSNDAEGDGAAKAVPTIGDAPVNIESAGQAEGSDLSSLPTALNLDGEQQKMFNELQAEYTATQQASTQRMIELKTQMMAALEAGDTEGAARLKAQMAALEAEGEQAEAKFLDNVNAMLDDDQRATFANFRMDQQIDDDLKGIDADLRDVLRAAMRLKLERTQKQQIRELAKSTRDRLKKARKTDRKNRDRERTAEKRLADQVRAEVQAMLTAEQSAEYTQALEKLSKKRSRSSNRR